MRLVLLSCGMLLLLCGRPLFGQATFPSEGLAFLEKHCLKCHNADVHEAEFRLDQFRDDLSLIKDRKAWEKVLERVQAGEMPPEKQPRPEQAEVNSLAELVAGIFERADREAKPDPGRVTIRRLNRVEYANTIRDLIGVDFDPTADFPSDDIGHGFDNIGDVLTLPPVLLERYLAAAEAISQRAIVTGPVKPPAKRTFARFAEPSGRDFPPRRPRPLLPEKSDSGVDAGPLHIPFAFDPLEEYLVRVHLSAEAAKDQTVQVSLLACGGGQDVPGAASEVDLQPLTGPAVGALTPLVVLQTFDVKPNAEAQTFEARLSRLPGVRRFAVAVRKWAEGQPPPKLAVEWFEVEGPLDFRPPSHRRLLACSPDKSRDEQTREVVTRFVNRAYRRPATPGEIDRLVALARAAQDAGDSWEVSLQRVIQAALVSPKFLFRVELDDRPEAPEPRPLDEFQLASRMSYFLWSSLPDDELRELAAKGQLTASLEPQVRRMLKDPKAKSLVDNFAMQWLQLRRLRLVAPDGKQFPKFDERLRQAMLKETELFFAEIVREDRGLLDLVDADFTYLNESLARHYGIVDTNGNRHGENVTRPGGERIRGDEFVRVSLSNKDRGGLLTQASVLTVTSNPTRTSPVKRGRWILEQILGTPPPPPPPNVPELDEGEKAQLTGSLRQRLEQHRAKPSCANCHARMDPIGFAFENYDAIGGWRTRDGEFPIETSGVLPDGTTVQNAADLKTLLREKRKDQVRRCVTEKLLIYALGRGLEYYDSPTLARILPALNDDDRFSRLVLEIVKSDPFRLRRGSKTE